MWRTANLGSIKISPAKAPITDLDSFINEIKETAASYYGVFHLKKSTATKAFIGNVAKIKPDANGHYTIDQFVEVYKLLITYRTNGFIEAIPDEHGYQESKPYKPLYDEKLCKIIERLSITEITDERLADDISNHLIDEVSRFLPLKGAPDAVSPCSVGEVALNQNQVLRLILSSFDTLIEKAPIADEKKYKIYQKEIIEKKKQGTRYAAFGALEVLTCSGGEDHVAKFDFVKDIKFFKKTITNAFIILYSKESHRLGRDNLGIFILYKNHLEHLLSLSSNDTNLDIENDIKLLTHSADIISLYIDVYARIRRRPSRLEFFCDLAKNLPIKNYEKLAAFLLENASVTHFKTSVKTYIQGLNSSQKNTLLNQFKELAKKSYNEVQQQPDDNLCLALLMSACAVNPLDDQDIKKLLVQAAAAKIMDQADRLYKESQQNNTQNVSKTDDGFELKDDNSIAVDIFNKFELPGPLTELLRKIDPVTEDNDYGIPLTAAACINNRYVDEQSNLISLHDVTAELQMRNPQNRKIQITDLDSPTLKALCEANQAAITNLNAPVNLPEDAQNLNIHEKIKALKHLASLFDFAKFHRETIMASNNKADPTVTLVLDNLDALKVNLEELHANGYDFHFYRFLALRLNSGKNTHVDALKGYCDDNPESTENMFLDYYLNEQRLAAVVGETNAHTALKSFHIAPQNDRKKQFIEFFKAEIALFCTGKYNINFVQKNTTHDPWYLNRLTPIINAILNEQDKQDLTAYLIDSYHNSPARKNRQHYSDIFILNQFISLVSVRNDISLDLSTPAHHAFINEIACLVADTIKYLPAYKNNLINVSVTVNLLRKYFNAAASRSKRIPIFPGNHPELHYMLNSATPNFETWLWMFENEFTTNLELNPHQPNTYLLNNFIEKSQDWKMAMRFILLKHPVGRPTSAVYIGNFNKQTALDILNTFTITSLVPRYAYSTYQDFPFIYSTFLFPKLRDYVVHEYKPSTYHYPERLNQLSILVKTGYYTDTVFRYQKHNGVSAEATWLSHLLEDAISNSNFLDNCVKFFEDLANDKNNLDLGNALSKTIPYSNTKLTPLHQVMFALDSNNIPQQDKLRYYKIGSALVKLGANKNCKLNGKTLAEYNPTPSGATNTPTTNFVGNPDAQNYDGASSSSSARSTPEP